MDSNKSRKVNRKFVNGSGKLGSNKVAGKYSSRPTKSKPGLLTPKRPAAQKKQRGK